MHVQVSQGRPEKLAEHQSGSSLGSGVCADLTVGRILMGNAISFYPQKQRYYNSFMASSLQVLMVHVFLCFSLTGLIIDGVVQAVRLYSSSDGA